MWVRRATRVVGNERGKKMPSSEQKKKAIPKFRSEKQGRELWAKHDSSEYVDWHGAGRETFANLKPSTKSISVRLPQSLIDELKRLANKRDVPYQTLLRIFLADRVSEDASVSRTRSASHPVFISPVV